MIKEIALDYLRLCLYGLAGVLFGMTATLSMAAPATVTYSYQMLGLSPPIIGNGLGSFAAARTAMCGRWDEYFTSNPASVSYTLTSCSVDDAGQVSVGSLIVGYTNHQDSTSGSYTITIQVVRITACPSGESAYVFAENDIRCRPAYCENNVGKYTSITVPTGTTANGVLVAPTPPANLCMNGCVSTNVSGLSFGLEGDTNQSWSFSGVFRFTGVPCVDQPGLTSVTGFTPPQNLQPNVGGGSSEGGGSTNPNQQANADNLATIAEGTQQVIEKLDEIKQKFTVSLQPSFYDCNADTVCTGDEHQCALALNARTTACALGPGKGQSDISEEVALASLNELANTTPGTWWGQVKQTVNLPDAYYRPRWMTDTGCPTVPNFTVMGHSFPVSLQPMCDYKDLIALILIVTASMIAYRILAGG